MSPQSIILLSPVKMSESGEKYAQIKHCLHVKRVLNKNVGGQQGIDFVIGWSVVFDYAMVWS